MPVVKRPEIALSAPGTRVVPLSVVRPRPVADGSAHVIRGLNQLSHGIASYGKSMANIDEYDRKLVAADTIANLQKRAIELRDSYLQIKSADAVKENWTEHVKKDIDSLRDEFDLDNLDPRTKLEMIQHVAETSKYLINAAYQHKQSQRAPAQKEFHALALQNGEAGVNFLALGDAKGVTKISAGIVNDLNDAHDLTSEQKQVLLNSTHDHLLNAAMTKWMIEDKAGAVELWTQNISYFKQHLSSDHYNKLVSTHEVIQVQVKEDTIYQHLRDSFGNDKSAWADALYTLTPEQWKKQVGVTVHTSELLTMGRTVAAIAANELAATNNRRTAQDIDTINSVTKDSTSSDGVIDYAVRRDMLNNALNSGTLSPIAHAQSLRALHSTVDPTRSAELWQKVFNEDIDMDGILEYYADGGIGSTAPYVTEMRQMRVDAEKGRTNQRTALQHAYNTYQRSATVDGQSFVYYNDQSQFPIFVDAVLAEARKQEDKDFISPYDDSLIRIGQGMLTNDKWKNNEQYLVKEQQAIQQAVLWKRAEKAQERIKDQEKIKPDVERDARSFVTAMIREGNDDDMTDKYNAPLSDVTRVERWVHQHALAKTGGKPVHREDQRYYDSAIQMMEKGTWKEGVWSPAAFWKEVFTGSEMYGYYYKYLDYYKDYPADLPGDNNEDKARYFAAMMAYTQDDNIEQLLSNVPPAKVTATQKALFND